MAVITFLGTGGGRFATIYQPRWTGGIYIEDSFRLHIDPGPGALVHMLDLGLDPTLTDILFVSHAHPDHYSDVEVLIEAMTHGCRMKRGILLASRSIIRGIPNYDPSVSIYHRSHLAKTIVFTPGNKYSLDGVTLVATPTYHSDRSAVGLQLTSSTGDKISYTCDTELRENVVAAHRGARILIVCATCPQNLRIQFHMPMEDVAEFINQIKPELAILTHFGLRVLSEGPDMHAKFIEERTGVRTVAARDGLRLETGKTINIYYDTVVECSSERLRTYLEKKIPDLRTHDEF
jgi:ribonuclease BN (tRNA processing enzyme)